ncbi:MAG: hypothetical protein NZ761_01955 [Dehalococcoidia bacterium]|nr:hypothetical protein [Dehalococcoidia bacterium]
MQRNEEVRAMPREIVVESIEPAVSRVGTPFWRVRVRGEQMALFVWDEEVAKKLRPGRVALVEVGGTGQFPRITAVYERERGTPADDELPSEWEFEDGADGGAEGDAFGEEADEEEPAQQAGKEARTLPAFVDPLQRELRMLRMSALRAAADVYAGSAVTSEELIAYAEKLVAWLLSDEPTPPLPE